MKMAVFDLDNTLLNDDKQLTKETLKALSMLKAAGVMISCATGRHAQMTKPFAKAMGANGAMICNNGALLKDCQTQKTLFQKPLDDLSLSALVDYALVHDIKYAAYSDSGIITNRADVLDIYQKWNDQHASYPLKLNQIKQNAHWANETVYKVLYMIEPNRVKAIKADLKTIKNIKPIRSTNTFLDIVPSGVDKWEALKAFAASKEIEPKDIIAFGDNDNDALMLQSVGCGFAMKNASKKAKAAANYITKLTNDQDGVALVLRQLDQYCPHVFKKSNGR